MIKVNGKKLDWVKGMTVRRLLELKRYTYPRIVVKINDKIIEEKDFDSKIINDKDDVKCYHLMAGG